MVKVSSTLSAGVATLAQLLRDSRTTPQGDRQAPTQTAHFDALVVGSGYGGAVAASRLAQNTGWRIAVLERGLEYQLGDFPSTQADLPTLVRFTLPKSRRTFGNPSGLYDIRLSQDFNVLIASGLGGGSLINAGVMEEAHPQIFEQRDAQGRRLWPLSMSAKSLAPYYQRALATIAPEQIPANNVLSDGEAEPTRSTDQMIPLKALAMKQLASGTGLAGVYQRPKIAVTFTDKTNAQGVRQFACTQCGDCFTGCNFGAKNTLDRNYLTLAVSHGAQLFTGVTVTHIEPLDAQRLELGWKVFFDATDQELRERLGANDEKFIVTRRLILSAGTLGSTEILKRSVARNTFHVSSKLGESFSGNGDMMAVGVDQTVPVHASATANTAARYRHNGPTITSMVDLREAGRFQHGARAGLGPVIQEISPPASLRWLYYELVGNTKFLKQFSDGDFTSRSATLLSEPAAIEHHKIYHSQLYAIFGVDTAFGRLNTFEEAPNLTSSGSPALFLDGRCFVDWPEIRREPAVNMYIESHAILRELLNTSATAKTLLPNPAWEPFSPDMASVLFGSQRGPMISVHPLGGCVIGDDASNGVVNQYGQVFQGNSGSSAIVYDNLVVLDGAIIPSSLGINPSLSITAVAERAIEYLCEHWKVLDQHNGQHSDTTPRLPFDADRLAALHRPVSSGMSPDPAALQSSGFCLAERMLGTVNLPLGDDDSVRLAMEVSIGPILDVNSFTADPSHALPLQAGKITLFSRDAHNKASKVFPVSGHIQFSARKPTSRATRIVRSAYAFVVNGGLFHIAADAWGQWRGKIFKGEVPWTSYPRLAWSLASILGEQRNYHYQLNIEQDVLQTLDPTKKVLQAGDVIYGTKTFKWGFRTNPWVQFTTLELFLVRKGSSERLHIGQLRSDLSYFANFSTYLVKAFQQGDYSTSLTDLVSLISFFTRAIMRTHLFNLRAPVFPTPADIASELHDEASLPQAIGQIAPERFRVELPDHGPFKNQFCELSRYRTASQNDDLEPKVNDNTIVLIHGFGASGNTFSQTYSGPRNITSMLCEQGFDVWVLDLRTSNANPLRKGEPYSLSFDDIGEYDIPFALKTIAQHKAKDQTFEVSILAHCVGVPMLMHCLLGGHLPSNVKVKQLVCTQVGLVTELTAYNYARASIIAAFRQFIPNDYFDTRVTLEQAYQAAGNKAENHPSSKSALDWLLSSMVYPRSYWWKLHNFFRRPRWVVQFHRITAAYGVLMNLNQVSYRTLNKLHVLIGGINLSTYSQTIFFALVRRLTNRHGLPLPSVSSINQHLNFPILFLSGAKNLVFHSSGAQRSAQLVAQARQQAQNHQGHGAYHLSIADYGHQDIWLGKKADLDVAQPILSFLQGQREHVLIATPNHLNAVRTVYASTLGPSLGWLRHGKNSRHVIARVQFSYDRVAKAPESFLVFIEHAVVNRLDKHSRVFSPGHLASSNSAEVTSAATNPNAAASSTSAASIRGKVYVYRPPSEERVSDPIGEGSLPLHLMYLDIEIPLAEFEPEFCANTENLGFQVFVLSVHADEPIDITSNPVALPFDYTRALRQCHDQKFGAQLDHGHAATLWHDLGALLENNELSRDQTNPEIRAAGFDLLDRRQHYPSVFISHRAIEAADRPDLSELNPHRPESLHFAVSSCQAPYLLVDADIAGASFRRLATRVDEAFKGVADPEIVMTSPQFLLMIGDQVYMDASLPILDAPTGLASYERPYHDWLGHPSMRSLASRLPIYPMLDDHEVANNFQPQENPDLREKCMLDLYQAYQRKLGPTGEQEFVLNAGAYPFFIMDTRLSREPRTIDNVASACILGAAQMKKLQDWLLEHRDRPKFVAAPSVVFPLHSGALDAFRDDPMVSLGEDGWDGYPASFIQLFEFVAKHRIRNLVLLCGDYHMSSVSLMELNHQDHPGEPVTVMSIISSGSYSPFRAALSCRTDIDLCCENVQLTPQTQLRYRSFDQTITFANSAAIVGIEGLTLSVCFATSDGDVRFSRRLDAPYEQDF